MAKNIQVAHYIVGHSKPTLVSVSKELEPLQDLVGGYIEVVPMPDGMVLVCNEYGRINNLPCGFLAASRIGVIDVRGNFFICRQRGSEFASITTPDLVQLPFYVTPEPS